MRGEISEEEAGLRDCKPIRGLAAQWVWLPRPSPSCCWHCCLRLQGCRESEEGAGCLVSALLTLYRQHPEDQEHPDTTSLHPSQEDPCYPEGGIAQHV